MSELAHDSRVTVLHALPRPVGKGNERKQHAEAETLLREAGAALEESRRAVERVVAVGDPAREIVRTARSRNVDLIMVGGRGLRTLGRVLLGSVSETVLHQADRPVVIVRDNDGAIR